MDQSQTPRYVSRFESLLYVPAFTQKNFHYMSTQDLPHREPPPRIWQIQIRSTQLLYPTKQPLHKRQGTTTITSHKRDLALSQTIITSSLRRTRHKVKSITITSTRRGIATNPITISITSTQEGWTQTQSKKRLQLLEISKTTNTLGHHYRPQTNFLTKTRSYR